MSSCACALLQLASLMHMHTHTSHALTHSSSLALSPTPSLSGVRILVAAMCRYIFFTLIAVPFQFLAMGFCWFLVLFVPMSKVSWRIVFLSYTRPLLFDIEHDYPGAGREVCVSE
jgi:hypothetical protein